MWLKNGFNTKKIFFHIALLISLVIFTNRYVNQYLAISLLILLIIYFVWLFLYIAKNGLYILIKSFNNHGEDLQVRDLIIPFDFKKSYREIGILNYVAILSRSPRFDQQNKEWLYLDIVRLLTEKKIFKKILILGGGGSSLATCFAKKSHVTNIDVIEYSQPMIDIAKKYFPTRSTKIKFICADAIKYNHYAKKKYDLIIIDLFEKQKINARLFSDSFIKQVEKTIQNNGFFIMNLDSTDNISTFIKKWSKSFFVSLYLHHNNFFISNINRKKFNRKYNCRLIANI